MMSLFKRLVKEEEGQGLVEYGLIIALVSVVLVGGLLALSGDENTGLRGIFNTIVTELDEDRGT